MGMVLRPLSTGGKVNGTGTVTLSGHRENGGLFGGAMISADGTNVATVIIRKNDANGEVIFDVATATALPMLAPIETRTDVIYYSVTGTNASAMLYEWVP